MAFVVDIFKACLTRIIFAAHGFVAIWRVTDIKDDPLYWYLAVALVCLFCESIFTLSIKRDQEWKWFCPSVFFYLSSVIPAIWLLELDKLDRRLIATKQLNATNLTTVLISTEEGMKPIQTFGVDIEIPVKMSRDDWAMVIEQLLMLILIIGRWLLPKGELSRDQLSQLLLVYIGTAADIIEFFDSIKDDFVATQPILCYVILGIWSWSLMQFTLVLTATKSRKHRISATTEPEKKKKKKPGKKKKEPTSAMREVCCSIDVWGILINIILQDAPFFILRLLLIFYFGIISYMNIFFTTKNTLVITLQFYRLLVVHTQKRKAIKERIENNKRNMILKEADLERGGGGGRIKAVKPQVKTTNRKSAVHPTKPALPPVKPGRKNISDRSRSSSRNSVYVIGGEAGENETQRRHQMQAGRTRRRSLSSPNLECLDDELPLPEDEEEEDYDEVYVVSGGSATPDSQESEPEQSNGSVGRKKGRISEKMMKATNPDIGISKRPRYGHDLGYSTASTSLGSRDSSTTSGGRRSKRSNAGVQTAKVRSVSTMTSKRDFYTSANLYSVFDDET